MNYSRGLNTSFPGLKIGPNRLRGAFFKEIHSNSIYSPLLNTVLPDSRVLGLIQIRVQFKAARPDSVQFTGLLLDSRSKCSFITPSCGG
jgi:hypothetical protein